MMIAKEHEKFSSLRPKSAKYWLLAEFSKLDGFGEEVFTVPKNENTSNQVDVAVGPHGLVIYSPGQEKKLWVFLIMSLLFRQTVVKALVIEGLLT